MSSVIQTLKDVDLTCYYSDGTTEVVKLKAPNGGANRFQIRYEEKNNEKFVTGSLKNKKGYTEYDLIVEYNYSSHIIDLHKIISSRKIDFQFPEEIVNPKLDSFIVSNREAIEEWITGLPIEYWNGSNGVNATYKTSISIVFKRVEPKSTIDFYLVY